jgi:ribosome recycling factor
MIEIVMQTAREKMSKSIEFLSQELAGIRSGHASPSLVEHLKVDYMGTPMPVQHIASVSAPEANLLRIQPWDKNAIRPIEKAILKSDLGLTPNNDGIVIRIVVPPLSEERRREMIKLVLKRVEDSKVAIRNLRREAIDDLKKLEHEKEISQDDQRRATEQVQKVTDNFIAQTEQIGKDKQAELTEV